MEFYARLEKLCKEKGMTVSKFAVTVLHLSRNAASKWKSGSIPQGKTLSQITEYFKVPLSFFFDSSENEPSGEKIFNITEIELLEIHEAANSALKQEMQGQIKLAICDNPHYYKLLKRMKDAGKTHDEIKNFLESLKGGKKC